MVPTPHFEPIAKYVIGQIYGMQLNNIQLSMYSCFFVIYSSYSVMVLYHGLGNFHVKEVIHVFSIHFDYLLVC